MCFGVVSTLLDTELGESPLGTPRIEKGEFTAELSARPWELLRGGGAAALQWVLLLVCIDPEVLYRFLPAVSTVGETSGLG